MEKLIDWFLSLQRFDKLEAAILGTLLVTWILEGLAKIVKAYSKGKRPKKEKVVAPLNEHNP